MIDYTSPCPYCGAVCECDLVDVGVGLVQCGPYLCESCGASEIGSFDETATTACERIFGWYGPGRPPSDKVNVIAGKIVSHQTMKAVYSRAFAGNPLWADKNHADRWWREIRK